MSITNPVRSTITRPRQGLRFGALAVTIGAFAGLSGLVAPTVSAQETHDVGGAIAVEYEAAAADNNQPPAMFFGPATTRELAAARGGQWQDFTNGNNAIYWHPLVSDGRANQIGGAVRDKWGTVENEAGDAWEHGPLRYPTTREWSSRESRVSGEIARGNHFEGGTIYSVPDQGTFVVWGEIRRAWWGLEAESSRLGLPVSDERVTDDGWIQDFEGGTIEFRDGRAAVNLNDQAPPPDPGEPGFDLEEFLGDLIAQSVEGFS